MILWYNFLFEFSIFSFCFTFLFIFYFFDICLESSVSFMSNFFYDLRISVLILILFRTLLNDFKSCKRVLLSKFSKCVLFWVIR